MAINSTLANQIFFASQGVPATGKENSAGQAYANEVAYAHAATYNPLEVLGGDTKEFVVKIYKTVLGRTNPLQDDTEGVAYWMNAINNGLSKAAFIDQMTAAAIKNGGSDKAAAEAANATYVNEIYSNILGRPASQDPAGSQYWIDALNNGTIARSKVVDEINAAAAKNKDAGFQTKNTEYVTNLYKDLLGRDPEAEGLKYWTDALNAGTSRAELVVSLINSANSGTGADKNNLAAKTEALNSFSANFTDYNILPGEGEYGNIRDQAGAKIEGINANTQDPAGEITKFLLNDGYKNQYQEGQPTQAATTVYATWNGALRAEWADATNTSDAEVTFKADTEEEKGLIRQAEKLGVDVSANTKNVKFKNLNGATAKLEEVHINSNPASQATVNVDALAQLPAPALTLIDRDGSTTIAWNSKVSNLTTIDLGNGDDNVIISNANNITGKVEINGGAGNDTLTLGTGNFAGKFTSLSDIEKIVTESQEAPTLDLKSVASYTGANDNQITEAGKALTVDNTLKLAISSSATTATKVDAQGNPVAGTVSGDIIAATIANFDGTGKVILETETANAKTLQKVTGSKALANDVLNLGTEKTFDVLGSGAGNYIEDIDLVAANKVILKYAQALEKGFTLAGDVDGLTAGSLILNDTTSEKIDASKLKAVAGSTLEISGAANNVKNIIGSTDANLSETVKLASGVTYSALESLKDLSLVESNGAKLGKIDAVNAGFNLKGDLTATVTATQANNEANLSAMKGVLKADGSKSKITIDAGNGGSNNNLSTVLGSTDENLADVLNLSGSYTALKTIKDIDQVKVESDSSIFASATVDGFDLVDSAGKLTVKAVNADSAIDLSKITSTTSAVKSLTIDLTNGANVSTIVGSTAESIQETYAPGKDVSHNNLTSIDQVHTITLNTTTSTSSATFAKLASITNAVDVTINKNTTVDALTKIEATGAVDVKAATSHKALTSIAGKTVDLGSGDFTALTNLTGIVKGDKANAAKLSYDKLATQLKDTGLVLDGSDSYKVSIKATTSTENGAKTDLSKVTQTGGESGAITITEANNDVVLSAKGQKIAETIVLNKSGNGAITITNVQDGQDKIDIKTSLGLSIASAANWVVGNGANTAGAIAVADGKVAIAAGIYDSEKLANSADAAEFLRNGAFFKDASSVGDKAIIAINAKDSNKAYIYAYEAKATADGIQGSELTLLAVAADTNIKDAVGALATTGIITL